VTTDRERLQRYDWLLLDADGTLFDFEAAAAAALERACDEVLGRFEPEWRPVYEAINSRLWRGLERGDVTADDIRRLRFSRFAEAVGESVDGLMFDDTYRRHLGEQARLLDGAADVVRSLHGRVGMALATNGLADVQRGRLGRSEIGDLFDPIVISEEVGAAKPDPAYFEAAFERMGRPPRDRILMVGDSLASDMRGGLAAGIDTCWFNPAAQPPDPEVPVRYDIRSLAELEAVVWPMGGG
jgi:YjjG family noncanonical pyrimidine nucleotidase